MSTRKIVLISIIGVVGLAAWYAFRPERLFMSQVVNEAFPTANATAADPIHPVSEGRFHGVAHETRGTAAIYELPGGKRVLRLSEFETSNGPDVNVYLVAATDATDNDTVTNAGFLPLGSLKGNVGDQNYEVPADADLSRYRAVTIWCRRFGVNFGTAPLETREVGPKPVASGSFHDVAHATKGMATIYELPDGKRVLRLTDFETSNGPDVNVYLVAATDATDNDTVTNAGFLPLGSLKGNVGDQNYEVPADADLSRYRAVTIWCRRFGVNFGTAPLGGN